MGSSGRSSTEKLTCIVTGSSGFIGWNLTKSLVAAGHEVYVTVTDGENRVAAKRILPRDFTAIPWHRLPPIDVVFHHAAIASTLELNRSNMNEVNVGMAWDLFCRSSSHGVKAVVYASSASVYGRYTSGAVAESDVTDPASPYAESKAELDRRCRRYECTLSSTRIVGLRYSNVYGPGERHKGPMRSVVRQCWESMSRGSRPRLYLPGTQRRDWVYVDDVVRANVLAATTPDVRGVVNIGTGIAELYQRIVEVLNRTLGTSLDPEWVENPIPPDRYQSYSRLDITRAREWLQWTPVHGLESGIAAYVKELEAGR